VPNLDKRELAAIFAGGFIGAIVRAAFEDAAPGRAGHWPWATFAVNVVGAFLLGYFATRLQERLPLSAYRRPLLGTGFCGALTTFSTVQVELLRMLDRGAVGLAVGYGSASAVSGLLAVAVASRLVRRIRIVV
jgi:CrcB protein